MMPEVPASLVSIEKSKLFHIVGNKVRTWIDDRTILTWCKWIRSARKHHIQWLLMYYSFCTKMIMIWIGVLRHSLCSKFRKHIYIHLYVQNALVSFNARNMSLKNEKNTVVDNISACRRVPRIADEMPTRSIKSCFYTISCLSVAYQVRSSAARWDKN